MKSKGVPSYAQALILAVLIIVVTVIVAFSCSEQKSSGPAEPTTPPTVEPEPTTNPEPTTYQGGESTTSDSLPDTSGSNPTH